MIRWLYRYISTPSRYSGDPRGYLLNQTGHAWAVGAPIGWVGGPDLLAALMCLYIAAIEVPQLLLCGGTLDDSAEDTGHVLCGALAVAVDWRIAAIQLLWLVAGALSRRASS